MARSVFSRIGGLGLYGVALLLGVSLTYYWFHTNLFAPLDPGTPAPVAFIVERGATLRDVLVSLEEKGLVKNWRTTWLLARMQGEKLVEANRSKIVPGEYELAASMTPLEILKKFINEEIVYHTLVITPGSTVRDVSKRLVETTLATPAEADTALSSPSLMVKLGVPDGTFEGYLFPETYKFTRPDNAELMVTRIVEEGKKRITRQMLNRAMDLGMTMRDVMILASIIEKETGDPRDRKLISSVFHNRLRLNMPLQSDPTVIYGIPNFDNNLTRAHLETPHRYNTYLKKGLPPTPISNPSISAVEATLYPADTDYLYFVAKGDGTSQFSSNYREHREAVRKYQLNPAKSEEAPLP